MIRSITVALLLVALGCGNSSHPQCAKSIDCKSSEVCIIPTKGDDQCIPRCSDDGGACQPGYVCSNVNTADCPFCTVVTLGCTPK